MTELEKCQLAKERGYTYNHSTGEIKGMYGKVIRKTNKYGYTIAQVYYATKRFYIRAHRLAWFLHYGTLPINFIDHIDGNRSNNRIDNLRDVSSQQNQWNQTTAKGYCWMKNRKKFKAAIGINGNRKTIGYFNTEQEARNAYLKAKETYHVINA